jgi:clathrin heavy chain
MQRNRLKLILPWLEACGKSGSQGTAKIYIDSNSNPEVFLKENNVSKLNLSGSCYWHPPVQLYEPLVVGKFCEAPTWHILRMPKLCDNELIVITNDNFRFKQQARYLVKCTQLELWVQVLVSDNLHRRQLVGQVKRYYLFLAHF